MIDNLQDIKNIIQEEKKEEKTEKELYNNLIKYLYNIFDEEIRPDLLERAFIYFNYNNTRQEICNDLAESQKEYNFYFMNYTKALKQVKSFFTEDIKKINTIKQQEQEKEQEKLQANYKKPRERQKTTIFGVNPIIFILLAPVVLFFHILDQTK